MPRRPSGYTPRLTFRPVLPLRLVPLAGIGIATHRTSTDLHVVDARGRTVRVYVGGSRTATLARRRLAARRWIRTGAGGLV